MANYNPNQAGLKQRHADDTTGPTAIKSFRIEIDMLEWLTSLDGQKASGKHVRSALRDYQKKIQKSLDES